MAIKLPKKIFEKDITDIEIGINKIHLYSEDEIEYGQQGYRVNGLTNEPIDEWIGDEYYVIGNDSCCGDPIIAKIDDENTPIYTMFHDDWSSLSLIAESFEQYIEVLELISETELDNIDQVDKLMENISKLVPESAFNYYWDDLIKNAYEFLTEED